MQYGLFDVETVAKFPSTRYQGSKLKYVDWIWYCLKDLQFDTVLDAFGGTGSVAYRMKKEGKTVSYNDILAFNAFVGQALIENDSEKLNADDLDFILHKHQGIDYPNFIEKTFSDTYFTDEENRWLDVTITNINQISNAYKKAIALFALFQACIIKRPFNLFHRKNLYIRTQEVERTFGNKVTWDTPFPVHFQNFVREANEAIFSNSKRNVSLNKNVSELPNHYNLVYIDPPYISEKGVGLDYLDFYHFLEGLVNYKNWHNLIDYKSKHKRLLLPKSDWTNAKEIEASFVRLIHQFSDSILAISYRSDGIPSIACLKQLLLDNGKQVVIHESKEMKYVLSKKQSTEILIVGY